LRVRSGRLHAQLGEQRLDRKILRTSFSTDRFQTHLLESGSDSRDGCLEAQPLTPELSVASAAQTDHRTGTVILVLKPDIADRIGTQTVWRSARRDCCGGHLPHVAAPVVVEAGVLAAVDPDLVVEDNGDR
jgi:hypothetical protein